VKNGTFSNKFSFYSCYIPTSPGHVTESMCAINYQALSLDAGGVCEFVFREPIKFDAQTSYCIYNGMPLRPEFRVFYDFDRHRCLYIRNYWDYDYCEKYLGATDKVVFNAARDELELEYQNRGSEVLSLVSGHMKDVNMEGIWSIDILWDGHKYWLIDMAIGRRSAYYDPKIIQEYLSEWEEK